MNNFPLFLYIAFPLTFSFPYYYANHPEIIVALKHEIEVAIHGMEVQTIENVLKSWVDRMGYCKASRGSHLNDLVFHS